MSSDIKSYLEMARPVNLLLGIISIFLGAFLTGTLEPLQNVILACLSGMLIMAAGNVLNDFFDLEIDRVNKAHRPLPAQKVTPDAARNFSIILFALGNFLSIFITWYSLGMALVVSAGLFLYNFKLKRTVLLGNLTVSLIAACAFVYGGLAVGHWRATMIPAGLAFLFHLGREIIKDIEDRQADRSKSAQTLPVRFGIPAALSAASVVFAILILFTFLPYLLKIYSAAYFWIALIGVDLVVIVALIFCWFNPFPDSLKKISTILKADMFVGLLAIYFGLPG